MHNLRSNVSKGVVVASLLPLQQETASSAYSARYPEYGPTNAGWCPHVSKTYQLTFGRFTCPTTIPVTSSGKDREQFFMSLVRQQTSQLLTVTTTCSNQAPHMLTAKMQIYGFLGYIPTQVVVC